MKKSFIAIILSFILSVLTLCGCTKEIKSEDAYSKVNGMIEAMLQDHFSEISLSIEGNTTTTEYNRDAELITNDDTINVKAKARINSDNLIEEDGVYFETIHTEITKYDTFSLIDLEEFYIKDGYYYEHTISRTGEHLTYEESKPTKFDFGTTFEEILPVLLKVEDLIPTPKAEKSNKTFSLVWDLQEEDLNFIIKLVSDDLIFNELQALFEDAELEINFTKESAIKSLESFFSEFDLKALRFEINFTSNRLLSAKFNLEFINKIDLKLYKKAQFDLSMKYKKIGEICKQETLDFIKFPFTLN